MQHLSQKRGEKWREKQKKDMKKKTGIPIQVAANTKREKKLVE